MELVPGPPAIGARFNPFLCWLGRFFLLSISVSSTCFQQLFERSLVGFPITSGCLPSGHGPVHPFREAVMVDTPSLSCWFLWSALPLIASYPDRPDAPGFGLWKIQTLHWTFRRGFGVSKLRCLRAQYQSGASGYTGFLYPLGVASPTPQKWLGLWVSVGGARSSLM